MSSIPKVEKPKYNNSKPFEWVDSQWEKFMSEQKELKALNKQLQEDLITCNNHFQKQRDNLLKLEMENAELKDMVLDLGGDYTENKWGSEPFQGNKK
tara:strand:- start:575 stop:865 length:291 start_codon:yes stop_codon:yes gene_type:complete